MSCRVLVDSVQEALTPKSRTADQKLGAQIFSKAAEWFQDELMTKDLRYINDIPSAIKIYHSLASVILTQTPERRDQLINDLLDTNGRWRSLKDGHKLYHEIQALAQRVEEDKMIAGAQSAEVNAAWLSALERVIRVIERDQRYLVDLGINLMTWKNSNKGYSARELYEYLKIPARKMMINAQYTLPARYNNNTNPQFPRRPGTPGMAFAFTPTICFQYREQGKCTEEGCPMIHEGRSGNQCTDKQYLETGICSKIAEYQEPNQIHY